MHPLHMSTLCPTWQLLSVCRVRRTQGTPCKGRHHGLAMGSKTAFGRQDQSLWKSHGVSGAGMPSAKQDPNKLSF